MDLEPYVEALQVELVSAAEAGGDEARALAARLMSPLDAAVRLTLQDALVAAAEEITRELAPGSVELRLRGRDPEFVVSAPPDTATDESDEPDNAGDAASSPPVNADGDEGGMTRINLRMPDHLKHRVEQEAASQGVSVNSWLVRAATVALDRPPQPPRDVRAPRGGQRFTGWAR